MTLVQCVKLEQGLPLGRMSEDVAAQMGCARVLQTGLQISLVEAELTGFLERVGAQA